MEETAQTEEKKKNKKSRSKKEEKPEAKAEPETEPEAKTEPEPEIKPEEAITEPELEKEEQDDVEKETVEVDDDVDIIDSKLVDYTDMFPTKDTLTIITHLDVDGILSVAAINQMLNSTKKSTDENEKKLRVFFTSPMKIFSILAKSIPDINKIEEDDFSIGKLYICDLSLNRYTILGSSVYDEVKWYDHHEVDPMEQFDSEIENLELILDPTADSTTSIICEYFKIKSDLNSLADEVDTNNIKSDRAQRLRDIIGAMRLKYSGSKLKKALFEFAIRLSEDIGFIDDESFNTMLEDYNKWIESFKQISTDKIQTHIIKERKVGILELEQPAPVFAIYDYLKKHPEAPFDIIALKINHYDRIGKDKNNKFKNKKITKIEFRTHTELEIHELAKNFGGGGHKFASGATVMNGIKDEELIKNIESYLETL